MSIINIKLHLSRTKTTYNINWKHNQTQYSNKQQYTSIMKSLYFQHWTQLFEI